MIPRLRWPDRGGHAVRCDAERLREAGDDLVFLPFQDVADRAVDLMLGGEPPERALMATEADEVREEVAGASRRSEPSGSIPAHAASARLFQTQRLRAWCNPLSYRASNNRTKTAVVRLRQREGAGTVGKTAQNGFGAGNRGSEEWLERSAFRAVPAVRRAAKKEYLD